MADDQLDFAVRHPQYTKDQPLREKARDLYDGSHVVKAAGDKYLYRTKNETQDNYLLRLKRAVFDNWAEVVVSTRQALQWRKRPTRDGLEGLEEFVDDVDGDKTAADTFFKKISTDAAVDGLAWVLIDINQRIEGEVSEAEVEARNIRPIFKWVPGSALHDWDVGEDGKLLWVVIAQTKTTRSGWGHAAVITEQRVVWTREEWILYDFERNVPPGGDQASGKWKEVARLSHELALVPLVPFYGVKKGDWTGASILKDIIDHVLSIYQKFSDRDNAEFLSNSPILKIISTEKPDTIDISQGTGVHVIPQQGVQSEIGYLEPTGKGHEASRISERDLIRRIFEIMLRQTKRDSAQVQSEGSLREEARIYSSSLTSVAIELQTAEAECWRIMGLRQGKEIDAEIAYNLDFDDKAIADTMVNAFSKMVERRQLSRETFLKILAEHEVLPQDFDPDKEMRQIEEDTDKLSMPGFDTGAGPGDDAGEPTEDDDDNEDADAA